MASKIVRILKKPRVLVMLLFVLFSLYMIPTFNPEGAEISYIAPDSIFSGQLEEGMTITAMNGVPIKNTDDYSSVLVGVSPGDLVAIAADGQILRKNAPADPTDNTTAYLGLHVTNPDRTRLSLGLDLQGGARVVLKPIPNEGTQLDDEGFETVGNVLMARVNAYGLSNVFIREIDDVSGGKFLEIEMAGEGSEKVVDIVKSVGKFELKIQNQTVFTGDAIVPPIGEPRQDLETGQWSVPFTVTKTAGRQLMDAYVAVYPESPQTCTSDDECPANFACGRSLGGGTCLPRIEMYLDEKQAFSAPPAPSLSQNWLSGIETESMMVQVNNFEEAQKVKIVLEAGRLPDTVKALDVVSQDYIDPKLGKDFIRGAALAGLGALIAVLVVVSIRYKKVKITLPIMFTGVAEVVIILGMAAIIKWSIDLPAIAGIIAAVGTGVDHQIIITDEILGGQLQKVWSLKRRVKKAFKMIMIAAATTVAAMIPLAYPGFTGLYALRGFAIVTIIGVLSGIFITRPAYAKMAEILLEEEE